MRLRLHVNKSCGCWPSLDQIDLSHATLLTIPANFLSNGDSEPWIIEHREWLLRNCLRATYAVTEAVMTNPTIPNPSPILENLLRLAPADTRCQGLLSKFELRRM